MGDYWQKWQEGMRFDAPLRGDDRPIPTRCKDEFTVVFDMPSDPIAAAVMGGNWTPEHELDVKLAQELLSHFTYKPGWYFEIHRRPELSVPVVMSVRFMALDSRLRLSEIPIEGSFPIPYKLHRMADPAKAFFDWLRSTIWFVERHECDEWFQVNGVLPFDPHKDDWTVRNKL